jgi:UDP-N-acetylmuramyl tripeptide synthase
VLLGKNPAGLLNALDMLRPSPVPVLLLINAQGADGRDPSWLWDVPLERIGQRRILAGGDRARDLAVRLHYAGMTYEVIGGDLEAALAATGINDLDVIANYTAFQAIIHTRRGHRDR